MRRTQSWLAMATLLLTAVPALAFVRPEPSPLASREVRPAGFEAEPVLRRLADLDGALAAARTADLQRLGLEPAYAHLDARSGNWATLLLARPLIPGTGVGNDLTWDELGFATAPSGDAVGQAAWNELARFLGQNRRELGFDPAELVPSIGVADGGAIVQIYAARQVGGVPVRGAALTATVNHGNLILLGAERWGAIDASTRPTLSDSDAAAALESHLAPFELADWYAKPTLELLPLGVDGKPGHGWDHRLVWMLRPDLGGLNRFEAAIDAHSGKLLLLQDTNHYATRNVKGGVYPASYDGQVPDGVEVPGYPMPFATVTHGGGSEVTDSGGNLFDINGNITTQLQGPFVRILDNCGAISESITSGDLDLGVSPNPNCDTPPGSSSPGNTHSARTGFYELNRIAEMARGQSPSGPANAWLNAQLTSNMNINQTCNAFWNGSTVNFYREGGGCGNTGQLAGVFDHEWGHGLDDNGTAGTVSSPGEGIADLYAAFRLNTSCVGRGFFLDGSLCGGYGDPCTPASGCTGIRDVDWANRASGQPHTVTWVNSNPNCGSVHCRGALYSESAWDLAKRDLPTLYGMDDNTAVALATRLTFKGADNVTTWFVLNNGTQGGCAATGGYMQFLGVDDDNGNLADGTPHMQAIFAAFNRHEIACATPTVQDGGCASTPTQAPVVTATPNDTGADLSWAAVPNATSYQIHRADGEFQCGFGKVLVGETAGTFFQDSGLQNGREYSYIVTPLGGGATCMGPASSCASVEPAAGLSADSASIGICAGSPAVYTITVTPPFAPPVDMSITGNPAPSSASFSLDPVNGPLPQDTVLTIGNTGGVAPGDHVMTVNGDDGVTSFDLNLLLSVVNAAPGAATLVAPANGATNVATDVTLTWSAASGASGYLVEVDDDANFSSPEFSATVEGTSVGASGLAADTLYHWRVTADNACGDTVSTVFTFTTALEYCATPNLSIPDNGAAVTTSIVVPAGGANLLDLDLYIRGNHTWVGDVIFGLSKDGGANQLHFDRPGVPGSTFGCSSNGPDITLDDESGVPVESACPTNDFVGTFSPNVPLSFFDGQSISGTWTLSADDNAGGDSGSLLEWCLVPVVEVDPMPFLDGFESGDTSMWSATQN